MAKAPSNKIQEAAVHHVNTIHEHFSGLLRNYRRKWQELFYATYVFEVRDRTGEGQSKIFFPKCFEQVEKVFPRLTGGRPKFVLHLNTNEDPFVPYADMKRALDASQASLNYFWKVGQGQKKFRTWAKSGLVYGTAFAKVLFGQKVAKREETEIQEDPVLGAVEVTRETEKTLYEFPTFEVPDILDMYFDPRIEMVDDMYAIIENKDMVRKADLLAQKDRYFNLDKLKDINVQQRDQTQDNYKINKYQVEGINDQGEEDAQNMVNMKTYYGFFAAPGKEGEEENKPEDEKLMKITVVNDEIVIEYEELSFMPWEKFNPIEVPNQGVGTGVVEPIKKLQDAYNLTRNQRFENISLVINRMWLMKKGSSIDPRRLRSVAGNIIPVNEIDDIQPLQTADITGNAYNESGSLNTEIQQTLGTIDTTPDPSGGDGFTNLATGQRIRWNEYNARFRSMKENLEEALGRLGEKLLMMVGAHANQNPRVYDEKTQEFYEISKTVFDSVNDFYSVSVLSDSTASDNIENRRDEVLALAQQAVAFKAQGVNVDMEKVFKDIINSFPGRNADDYVLPPEAQAPEGGPAQIGARAMESAKVQPSSEEALNQDLTRV